MSLEGKATATQKVRGKISGLPHIPSIDKSLSVEGHAADAKAVGDAIAAIEVGVNPTAVLSIANGGTGATTADAARANIGAAATAHGHAIADVSGLQSALNLKANASAVPTKLSQLTNDVGFKTTDTDTNTTYSLSKSGNTITLTGSDGSKTSVTDSDTISTAPAASSWQMGVATVLVSGEPSLFGCAFYDPANKKGRFICSGNSTIDNNDYWDMKIPLFKDLSFTSCTIWMNSEEAYNPSAASFADDGGLDGDSSFPVDGTLYSVCGEFTFA